LIKVSAPNNLDWTVKRHLLPGWMRPIGQCVIHAQGRWVDWIDGNTGNDTAHCDYFDKLRNVDHYCYA
jgi:hypothetical protein